MKQRLRHHLDYFIRGLLMGGADIIPGVSGGTIALIVNVYERLIASISELVSFGLNAVRWNWPEAREHWRTADWGLLLPLGAGIVTALIGGARVIPGLMEQYPAHMQALFFGLVAASLAIPWRRLDRVRLPLVAIALIAAVGAFFFVGLPQVNAANPTLPRVFGSAAIAICAMILPGVSGAFLLEVLGIYAPTLDAVNSADLVYIATFVAGAATGLAAFAKILDFLLSRYHDATMAALIGLIAGALRALWPYTGPNDAPRWPEAGEPVATVIGIGLLGFIAVIGLIWWGAHRAETTAPVKHSSSA
jgi:putative membrane protein